MFAHIARVAALIAALFVPLAHAAPGDLDATFGNNGIAVVNAGTNMAKASAVAIQPDGKIVAGGSWSLSQGALVRWNADGSLDPSFGIGGRVNSSTLPQITGLGVQSSGKIVVAGGNSLARLNADGTPDATFGTGGATTLVASAYALIVQPDDTILVAGGSADFMVAKYTAGGALDTSFAAGVGYLAIDFGGSERAYAMARTPGGGIVLAGNLSSGSDTGIARITASGVLDTTLDADGMLTYSNLFFSGGLAVQGDDAILVGGSGAVVRLLPSGAPDTSFSGNGVEDSAQLNFPATFRVHAIGVQADGKIVFAGDYSTTGFRYQAKIERYHSDGTYDAGLLPELQAKSRPDAMAITATRIIAVGFASYRVDQYDFDASPAAWVVTQSPFALDTSFGAGGMVATESGAAGDGAYGVAVRPNGKIFLAGIGEHINNAASGVYNESLAIQLTDTGALDVAFGKNGVVRFAIASAAAFYTGAAVQADGKPIALGYRQPAPSGQNFIFGERYTETGTTDASFSMSPGSSAWDFYARSVAVAPDQKIVAAGDFSTGASVETIVIARFNSDGTADTGFGTNGRYTSSGGSSHYLNAVTVDAANRPVGVGTLSAFSSTPDPFYVIRLTSAGALDSTFGTGGIAQTTFGGSNSIAEANAVAIQADGKIVAVGTADGKLAAARYNTNGTLDAGFGASGKVLLTIGTAAAIGRGVVIQADGTIAIAGEATLGGTLVGTVTKLDASGAAITQFGASGTASYPGVAGFQGVALQPDGKLVAVGFAPVSPYSQRNTVVMRIIADDRAPNAFDIPDQADVPLGLPVTSASAVLSGLDLPATVTVSDGEYSIGCTSTFTASPGLIMNGESICVRHTASGSFSTGVTTTLTIGGVADTFTSTTVAANQAPTPFTFADQAGVEPNAIVVSAPVTITGIALGSTSIRATGGDYSIDCTGTFTSSPGTISNSQTVCVRHTSANYLGSVDTLLIVGGVSDTFTSTTRAADTTPDAFSFTAQTGVARQAWITSNTVTISGLEIPVAFTLSTYTPYSIGCTGSWSYGYGDTIANGQTICLQVFSSYSPLDTTSVTLDVGGVSSTFSVTTRDDVPDAMSFPQRNGVRRGEFVVSDPAQVTGIDGPVAVAADYQSQWCGSSGNNCACDLKPMDAAGGTIDNGQYICVGGAASNQVSTYGFAGVYVGGGTANFQFVTRDDIANPFSFTALTNQPLATLVASSTLAIAGIDLADVSVTNGEYSIDCTGTFTAAPGTMTSGQTVCLRHLTAATGFTTTTTTFSVGAEANVAGTFSSTTVFGDTTPATFSFTDLANAPRSALVTSAPVQVTAINQDAPISVSGPGGEYCVSSSFNCNCDVRGWGTLAATVANGRYACVRHTSSGAFATATGTTLDVGGVTDTFTSTTVADTTLAVVPPALAFPGTGLGSRSRIISATLTNNGAVPIVFGIASKAGAHAGQFEVESDTCTLQTVNPGASCALAASFEPASTGAKAAFVTLPSNAETSPHLINMTGTGEAPDSTPNAFTFAAQNAVPLTTQVTSAAITPAGFNMPLTITVADGEYSVGCTAAFSTSPGEIYPGEMVCARHLSSGSYSTTVTTTVTIGSVSAGFDSTTLAAYTLNVNKNGTGTGSVGSVPSGILCGADCSESFVQGTIVTLTATPNAGSAFAGWSGGGCSGTGSCQVTMGAGTTVTATFNVAAASARSDANLDGRSDVLWRDTSGGLVYQWQMNGLALSGQWDPLESTCRHASLSIL